MDPAPAPAPMMAQHNPFAPAPAPTSFAPAPAPYQQPMAPYQSGPMTGTTAMVVGTPHQATAAPPGPVGGRPGLDQLTAMGFAAVDAHAALDAQQGDVQRALNWLLGGNHAPVSAAPAPVMQVHAPAPAPVVAQPTQSLTFPTLEQPTIVGAGGIDPSVRFAHVAPDGTRNPYSAADNQLISAARVSSQAICLCFWSLGLF